MKEVKRADEAAKITRNLGFPSAPVVNKMLGGGSIERTRVTVRDNKNAIDMNGKPVEFLRGKQVKRKAEVTWVPPLKRHRESASLHTDIMFIAEEPCLVYLTTQLIIDRMNAMHDAELEDVPAGQGQAEANQGGIADEPARVEPEPDCIDEVEVSVDGSYGTHPDGKSHYGRIVSLGGVIVSAASSKQKIVTKSSTESELVGLSDSVNDGIGAASAKSKG